MKRISRMRVQPGMGYRRWWWLEDWSDNPFKNWGVRRSGFAVRIGGYVYFILWRRQVP